MLDKLGTVGVNQVRQMADLRFKETLEGKVSNTQNLRIDLRGSACDDPRINATLYDFDANGVAVDYLRMGEAAGSGAGADIQRTHQNAVALPLAAAAAVTVTLQADTSMGRLILEDLPERNLLLEAYKAKK